MHANEEWELPPRRTRLRSRRLNGNDTPFTRMKHAVIMVLMPSGSPFSRHPVVKFHQNCARLKGERRRQLLVSWFRPATCALTNQEVKRCSDHENLGDF
uniref:Uncharacterized protein n=1 Tax=Ixodes ricinus TaxID=34613 RepID=A0A6B0UFL4_IXORI